MPKIKKRFPVFIALSVLMCSCYGQENGAKITLGFNLPLTGGLAAYGQNCLDGAKLALEQIAAEGVNGLLIRPVILDNRSENADAALNSLRLAEIHAAAVIGPTNSNTAKSALSNQSGMPAIIPSATADSLLPPGGGENCMFRICYTDSFQGEAIGKYARELGLCRAAVLTESSSDYSRGVSEAFMRRFSGLGGLITSQEFYSSGECDFYMVLTRLAAQDFDALFVPGYYSEAGLIIRQMNELGIKAAVLSGDAFDSPALEGIIGRREYLNNIYFTNHYAPGEAKSEDFFNAFTKKYGRDPSAYAALGYDSVMLFRDAYIRSAESGRTLLQTLA
ncbi:MAG: ABC transporter substrate-binding protein, partial [Oscillospiraceae bacterium]|nr:ABC transporter substrate-binding protein [Oscillospiraceae bacterium]